MQGSSVSSTVVTNSKSVALLTADRSLPDFFASRRLYSIPGARVDSVYLGKHCPLSCILLALRSTQPSQIKRMALLFSQLITLDELGHSRLFPAPLGAREDLEVTVLGNSWPEGYDSIPAILELHVSRVVFASGLPSSMHILDTFKQMFRTVNSVAVPLNDDTVQWMDEQHRFATLVYLIPRDRDPTFQRANIERVLIKHAFEDRSVSLLEYEPFTGETPVEEKSFAMKWNKGDVWADAKSYIADAVRFVRSPN